jgi:hypothetical protein
VARSLARLLCQSEDVRSFQTQQVQSLEKDRLLLTEQSTRKQRC